MFAAHDLNMKPSPILFSYAIITSTGTIFYGLHEDGSASASIRAGAPWQPCNGAFFEIGSPAIVSLADGSFDCLGRVLENAVSILGPQPRAAS